MTEVNPGTLQTLHAADMEANVGSRTENYHPGVKRKAPESQSLSPHRRRLSPPKSSRGVRSIPNVSTSNEDELSHGKSPVSRKENAARAEYEKLLTMRSGGIYIPPARLRALQAQITDKKSKEYQRMAWEALKKSINGLINKVNVSNIKHIVPELFGENLVRGRGLFCRSIMKAQAASIPFTPIYAIMVAIVNTKLPQIGELLVGRIVTQFKKAFRRNDKSVCLSSTTFLAHLVNQQVVHEALVAQILLLLLHAPTDDSVEIAVGLTREVGQHLEQMDEEVSRAIFDQFRSILHEQDLDKRVQYMIEVLFQIRKDGYRDNPAVKEELDLVEEEDQITHEIELDDDIDVQDKLNIFKFDESWDENETAYKQLKAEILGETGESESEDLSDSSISTDEDADSEQERQPEIKDQSNRTLTKLRQRIYGTIVSSIDFEEACHKLMKIDIPQGLETELPSMIIEYCLEEKTYSKFLGLIGERFAKLNRLWTQLFEQSFATYYDTIHRYETNKLRNLARFFAHMLSSDAIGWHVLSVIHLNVEETTSSSRIYIKILFQDIAESLGVPGLVSKLRDEGLLTSLEGLFPKSNPQNTRFSINYFTSIGLGAITEDLREHLALNSKPTIPTADVAASRPVSERKRRRATSYPSSSDESSFSRSTSRARSRSESNSRRRHPLARTAVSEERHLADDVSYNRGRPTSRSLSSRSSSSRGSRSPSGRRPRNTHHRVHGGQEATRSYRR